jgi:hypothetical protein
MRPALPTREARTLRKALALLPRTTGLEGRITAQEPHHAEILKAFWNLPDNEQYANVVPPLLAYADLMATGEGRNLETARLIYDKFLEPVDGR